MRALPALLLLGCGDGGADHTGFDGCEPNDSPTLVLGSGMERFESDVPDHEVTLVHGAQGGFHIEMALRATGADTSDLVTARIDGFIDGEKLASSAPWIQLRCNPETNTQDAWALILQYDSTPPELDGKLTEVSVTVTDAAGAVLEASNTFTIVDPSL